MRKRGAGRWEWHPRVDKQLSLGQRAADRVASSVGSWPFIIIQSFLLLLWIVINARVLPKLVGGAVFADLPAWDKYPFILLNLMLSFQAAYTGPIVMISQNRQDQKRAELAQHDYETDQLAADRIGKVEGQMERVIALLEAPAGR
jgi:uncharacterized membrane protein